MNLDTKLDLLLKLGTLIGGAFAGVYAYRTYRDTKKVEYYRVFWNRKLELFLETSQAAAAMAMAQSPTEYSSARQNYFLLFFGRLSLVEGPKVKDAMVKFAKSIPPNDLKTFPFTPDQQSKLQDNAYELTIEMRNELISAWPEPFTERSEAIMEGTDGSVLSTILAKLRHSLD